VIFSEHSGENRMILLQTVAKWRCIKLCAVFSWPLFYSCVSFLFNQAY